MDRLSKLSNSVQEKADDIVLIETTNGVAVVSMNDKKTFNSLSHKMIARLIQVFTSLAIDEKVRVIVLKSNAKIFCSGANIKEFQSLDLKNRLRHDNYFLFKSLFQKISKPIIAVVNDAAFGGGFELALMCDLIIANKTAKFGFPEVKLGLIPGIGGTLISKVVGRLIKKIRCKQDDIHR